MKLINIENKPSNGEKAFPLEGKHSFIDEDWFKENVVRWGKAQDVMGIKQTLWVLRVEMGYKGWLHNLEPHRWTVLFSKLTDRYHLLVQWGKIDAKV